MAAAQRKPGRPDLLAQWIGGTLAAIAVLLSLALVAGLAMQPSPPSDRLLSLVVGLTLLGLLEVFGIWMFVAGRRLRRGVPGAIDRTSAACSALPPPGLWQEYQAGGVAYEAQHVPRAGKRPSCLNLRTFLLADLDLQFNAENWFDRLCKRLRIAHEFQSGNAAFDAVLYVRGTIGPGAAMALRTHKAQQALLRLRELGFPEVRAGQGWVEAEWRHFDPALHAVSIEAAGAALVQLARCLEGTAEPRVSGAGARIDPLARVHVALWLAVVGIGLLSFLIPLYRPLRWTPVLLLALPLAPLAWLGFAWLAAWLLHGHSRSHDRWLWLCGAMALLVAPGTLGALCGWNGLADPSPPVTRLLPVVDAAARSRKGNVSYHVRVRDWADAGELLEFRVDRTEYQSVQPGLSAVQLTTRAGRLGFEWQVGHRLASAAATPGEVPLE